MNMGLATVAYLAQDAASTVRAYIEGEGLWSKSQRDAVYHLFKYAFSQDPIEYERYKRYLQVPLGDRIARLELLKENPDFRISDQGFIQGGNDPKEVRAMSVFFGRYQKVSYMEKAIRLWALGDENIERLQKVAERLHHDVTTHGLTHEQSLKYMAEIDQINNTVRILEDQFSHSLGGSVRWLKNLLLWMLFSTLALFLGLGLIVAVMVSRKILRSIHVIQAGTEKIQAGDLSQEIHLNSGDELGQLARSFNHMTKSLEEQTRKLEIQRSHSAHTAKMVALGEMAGGIAHEINTPLATISLTAGLLNNHIENNHYDAATFLKMSRKIQETVKRISNIIQGLRNFSRDASKDPLTRVRLVDMVQDTISLCQERLRHNEIDLRIQQIPQDFYIRCRPAEICQVLVNLINNSFDSIHEASEKWIEISVHVKRPCAILCVTDSGPAISKDIQKKIFQPFFTTKDIGKGTGLGLSISAGILASHGGKIEYDEKSENARFCLQLPLAEEA
ncbi:MAG: sensor histidine kinase [Pseudobdellovibrionaceae bacterium]